ncbi:Gfo/Idh/MocA family protein [Nocardia brasiliensis]|uniref:Gfo/Idh/MocA family protein n=1 Tax=Nocardia brasiliensis TaxID=37326 RepID=UPI00366AC959
MFNAIECTVNWGFLGAGGIARTSLAPAVHSAPNACLHAVAARDRDRAELLRPHHIRTNYDALVEDPDVEVVYVALHNSSHLTWTLRALDAGKHVVCEKPLGLHADEVEQMITAARAADRLLVEACWNRWHPRNRVLERVLENNELGEVRSACASFLGILPPVGGYRDDPALGGGALYDVGCYAIAAVLLAFDWQQPTSVTACSRLTPTGADALTTAELTFPGGTATIRAGLTGELTEQFVVRGENATVGLEQPAFTAGAAPCCLLTPSGRIEFPAINPYAVMVEQVSAAVRGEDAYLVSPDQSLAVARVLDSIRTAAA